MQYPFSQALSQDSSIIDAKKMFTKTKCFSLPVVGYDKKLVGVVRIKDILFIDNTEQTIRPYISEHYISIQRPTTSDDIIKRYYSTSEQYTEIFITDYEGKLIDVINILPFVKNRIQRIEVMNEEQFLKQILRPTSLARCILDELNDAVILVDKSSTILYANQAYSNILGVDIQKITGRYLSKIEPEAKILDVLKTIEPVVGKIINIRSLGTLIMANITPIKFYDEVVGAISVFSDITKMTNIAAELEKMNLINKLLTQDMKSDYDIPISFKNIIGTSVKLRRQLNLAAKVASIESPVLILGESGTGKELLAKAIHEASPRKDGPFVSINCAAIPDNLLESELFGYEEGAFTGAKKGGKVGKFEQANEGTLFLDEIGDMPLTMQTKLLRFLQDKELDRVGGMKPKKIDVRFISATNKNLTQMIEEKGFREDLFYRINVFTITLPPLRERKIDIFNLVENYKNYYEDNYKKQVNFSPECLRFLLNYHWPGNVRELKNVLEHLVVMANDIIKIKNLPEYLRANDNNNNEEQVDNPQLKPLVGRVKDEEKKAILEALIQTNNNKSEAMKILGVSRRTFYKKLKELNLQ